MSEDNQTDQEKAQQQIKAVYEDGVATINGREYTLARMQHKQRRKVFAFFSKVQGDMSRGNFWWLESPEWEEVEAVINSHVLFNGEKLANLDTHWDNYPGDYMQFVPTMLGAMSYPFLGGVHTS